MAARRTVLVAEELVDTSGPGSPCDIPGVVTTAVVARPGAVYPDGAPGRYERDIAAYQRYAELAGDISKIGAWRRQIDYRARAVAGG